MSNPQDAFNPRLARRRLLGVLFTIVCIALSAVAVVVLGTLVGQMWLGGFRLLSSNFLSLPPNEMDPLRGGVGPALWGTIYLILLTAVISVPIGVGAAVYLEEYAAHNRLTRLIQLNISNLAGVPSVVYGILGLAVFVRAMNGGKSLLAGALTMSLLILPVIIIAAREALAAVPNTIRQAAYAMGATRWQTIRHHVLPAAMPGVLTGVILALSRAIGESAPLIMIGALAFTMNPPRSVYDSFTALPLVILNAADSHDRDQHTIAASTILLLLAVLLTMNAIAVGARAWGQRSKVW